MFFADWTRQEMLTLGAIVVPSIVGLVGILKIRTIHIMMNSRMSEFRAGAIAEGANQERAAADARARAEEVRSDQKEN